MCVVFTLNRSFYPTTSAHPVSVLILHPREILRTNYVVTDCGRKTKTTALNQGKASQVLAYLVLSNIISVIIRRYHIGDRVKNEADYFAKMRKQSVTPGHGAGTAAPTPGRVGSLVGENPTCSVRAL